MTDLALRFLFILLVIGLVAWGVRTKLRSSLSYQTNASDMSPRLMTIPLSHKARLHVVRLGDSWYMVGEGDITSPILMESPPHDWEIPEERTPDFRSLLAPLKNRITAQSPATFTQQPGKHGTESHGKASVDENLANLRKRAKTLLSRSPKG